LKTELFSPTRASWDDFVMDAGRWVPLETATPPFWKGDGSLAVKAGVLYLAGLFY